MLANSEISEFILDFYNLIDKYPDSNWFWGILVTNRTPIT